MSDLFDYNAATGAADIASQNAASPVKARFRTIYLCLLLGLLTPISLVAGFNYFNDRYGIFHSDRNFRFGTNLNFVRMKFLLENGDQHELILLGSSRANALDVTTHISESAYTIPLLGGVLYYHYLHLKTLIEKGIIPKIVILGIGEAAIRVPPKPNSEQELNARLHPLTEGINQLLYYWDYLAFIPGETDLQLFRSQLGLLRGRADAMSDYSLFFMRTGRFHCFECEQQVLQRTAEQHVLTLAQGTREVVEKNRRQDETLYETDYGIADAIEISKAIIELADSNGISLFIHIEPIYQELYLAEDIQSWLEFKRELSQISPFLDFSNFDSTFADSKNFIDPLHYNQQTGDRLLTEIQRSMNGRVDEIELGTWVTAENADHYLQQQQDIYRSLRQ